MQAHVRLSPLPALLLVLGVTALSVVWFHSPWFPRDALANVQRASGGWLSATLLAGGAFGVLQLLLVLGPGGQRFADLGWSRRKLAPATLAMLALWSAMQLSTVLASLVTGQPLRWHAAWAAGLGIALGPLLAQLAATALFEETLFRGWLWPQLTARIRMRRPGWLAPVLGLLVSQAIFALLHVPGRLAAGASAGEVVGMMLMLFVVGLVFALVYLATRNLFVAVGAHALGNAPTLLFEPQGPAPTLVLLGTLGLLLLLPWRRIAVDPGLSELPVRQ